MASVIVVNKLIILGALRTYLNTSLKKRRIFISIHTEQKRNCFKRETKFYLLVLADNINNF